MMTHLFSKSKAYTVKKCRCEIFMRRKILFLLVVSLVLFLLLEPEKGFAASASGLALWSETVLPSLLPFMILSNFIMTGGGIQKLFGRFPRLWNMLFGTSPAGTYALFLGLFCGYPMGAKLTADLFASHTITRREADYLLAVSSSPSPMFLSSYILAGSLHRPELAPAAFCAVYGGIFFTGLFLRLIRRSQPFPSLEICEKETSAPLPLGKRIDVSIMNGFEAAVKLGGYILIFSILAALLQDLLFKTPILCALLLGITEISTGIRQLAALPIAPTLTYSLILACAAFGGISVAAQTSSVIRPSGLHLRPYLTGKSCCALFTLLLSLFFFKIVIVF